MVKRVICTGMCLLSLCSVSTQAARVSVGYHTGTTENLGTSDYWQYLSVNVQEHVSARHPRFKLSASSGLIRNESKTSLADTWLSATRLGQKRHYRHWWDVQARLKLPTADAEKGLGTGAKDVEIRLHAITQYRDWVPWYYVGYRFRGSGDYFNVQDGALWAVGASVNKWYLSYHGQEATTVNGETQHELSSGKGFQLGDIILSPYLSLGIRGDAYVGGGITARF